MSDVPTWKKIAFPGWYAGQALYDNVLEPGFQKLKSKVAEGNEYLDEQTDSTGGGVDYTGTKNAPVIEGADPITLATINKQFNGDNNDDDEDEDEELLDDGSGDSSDEEYNQNLVNTYNKRFETGDGKTNIDDSGSDDGSGRKRPFKSLFDKLKGRIGSAQYDERAFLDSGRKDEFDKVIWDDNPNYNKLMRDPDDPNIITGEGKGVFGKKGGFMSKFGTGHGLLSKLGGEGGGLAGFSEGLSQMGSDLMSGGAYEYGNFYDTED